MFGTRHWTWAAISPEASPAASIMPGRSAIACWSGPRARPRTGEGSAKVSDRKPVVRSTYAVRRRRDEMTEDRSGSSMASTSPQQRENRSAGGATGGPTWQNPCAAGPHALYLYAGQVFHTLVRTQRILRCVDGADQVCQLMRDLTHTLEGIVMESIRGGAPAVRGRARRRSRRTPTGRARARGLVSATACLGLVLAGATAVAPVAAQAAVAPTGQGLTITPGDLMFILKQIKIAEHHAATQTPSNMCGTLVGPAADQIPDRLSSYGLRTVDGSCNNLFPGRETFAAADQVFPRLTNPVYRDAESPPTGFPVAGNGVPARTQSTYSRAGDVIDSQPRVISNLIVDQTSTNPAAVAAAGF